MTNCPSDGTLITRRPLLFATLAVVAIVVYASGAFIELGIIRVIAKPIPVLCCAASIWGSGRAGTYGTVIGIGLCCGALGDVLLESPSQTFLPGLVAFLVGHLLYIAGFLTRNRRPSLFRAVPSYLFGIVILVPLLRSETVQSRGLEIPVVFYMVVICGMVWRAWSALDTNPAQKLATQLALLGALLFLVSDSVLAVSLFLSDIPAGRLIVMTTYWLGQLGIAASAFPVARRNNP